MARTHPSGPTLPGHPKCGPGKIYDHNIGRCISLVAYRKKYGTTVRGTSKPKKV